MATTEMETHLWGSEVKRERELSRPDVGFREQQKKSQSCLRRNSPLSCEVPNTPSVPAFVEWGLELDCLEAKIQRSEEERERLQELQENIDRERRRLASEQVELAVQAIRRGMEASLMDLL